MDFENLDYLLLTLPVCMLILGWLAKRYAKGGPVHDIGGAFLLSPRLSGALSITMAAILGRSVSEVFFYPKAGVVYHFTPMFTLFCVLFFSIGVIFLIGGKQGHKLGSSDYLGG